MKRSILHFTKKLTSDNMKNKWKDIQDVVETINKLSKYSITKLNCSMHADFERLVES